MLILSFFVSQTSSLVFRKFVIRFFENLAPGQEVISWHITQWQVNLLPPTNALW